MKLKLIVDFELALDQSNYVQLVLNACVGIITERKRVFPLGIPRNTQYPKKHCHNCLLLLTYIELENLI